MPEARSEVDLPTIPMLLKIWGASGCQEQMAKAERLRVREGEGEGRGDAQ